MGAEVVVFSTTEGKEEARAFGASELYAPDEVEGSRRLLICWL
jgi:hypothetical protein